jgi:hypothetical protein
VVFALHRFAIEPTSGERDTSMWAEIAHRKQRTVGLAAKQHRDAQQHGDRRAAALERVRTHRRIPFAEDHLCRRT